MKKHLNYIFIFSFAFSYCFLNAQPNKKTGQEKTIDSLLYALKTTSDDTAKINILNAINWNYICMGSYEAPLEYAMLAMEIANKTGDKKLISISLRKVGNIYLFQLSYEKAVKYYLAALEMAEKTNDYINIAGCLNNLGNVYSRMAVLSNAQINYKKSLEFHLRTIDIRKKTGDSGEITNSLLNISNAYKGLGQQKKAIDYLLQALIEYTERGDQNGIDLAKTSLGEVYLDLAKKNGKQEYFNKAEEYFKERLVMFPKNKLERKAYLLICLGEICFLQKRQNEAISNLTKGVALAKKSKTTDVLRKGALLIAEALNSNKDYRQALEYHKLYTDLKDSLLNEQSNRQIAEMNTKYESEKKEKNIELLKKDKALQLADVNKQKRIRNSIIAGLVLVVLLAFLLLNRFIVKQKLNIKLVNKNNEMFQKNKLIEKQKEKIIDSITYAQHIQQSIMMEENEIKMIFPDSFIYYQPKDIVSGDFYWCSEINNKIILAAIDCTGHGVPGAFMSMIGNTLLNQIVNEKQITMPSEILDFLNRGVYDALHQDKERALSDDGMDIALCCIDKINNKLEYAGAQNPLYVISDNKLTIIKADIYSIGGRGFKSSKGDLSKIEYTNHVIPLTRGMNIYLFSDGYMDQFGGSNGKKFGIQKFKELLLDNQHLNMKKQKELIALSHEKWKENSQQIDDIMVIGLGF